MLGENWLCRCLCWLASQHTHNMWRVYTAEREESLVRGGGGQGHGRDVLETVAEGQSVSVSARHRSRLHRLFFTSPALLDRQITQISSRPISLLLLLLLLLEKQKNKHKYRRRLAARSFVKFKNRNSPAVFVRFVIIPIAEFFFLSCGFPCVSWCAPSGSHLREVAYALRFLSAKFKKKKKKKSRDWRRERDCGIFSN